MDMASHKALSICHTNCKIVWICIDNQLLAKTSKTNKVTSVGQEGKAMSDLMALFI